MSRRRTNGSRSRLGPELEGMLSDFCEAHHVANAHEITKRAVREFILRDIGENAGIRKEFERLQKLRKQLPELKVVNLSEKQKKP